MTNWAKILQLAIEHARSTGQRPYVFGALDGTHWRYYFCRHYFCRFEQPCPYVTVTRLQPPRER